MQNSTRLSTDVYRGDATASVPWYHVINSAVARHSNTTLGYVLFLTQYAIRFLGDMVRSNKVDDHITDVEFHGLCCCIYVLI